MLSCKVCLLFTVPSTWAEREGSKPVLSYPQWPCRVTSGSSRRSAWPSLHLLCLRSQGEAFPAQGCGRCNGASSLPRPRLAAAHAVVVALSWSSVLHGSQEAARYRKASPAPKAACLADAALSSTARREKSRDGSWEIKGHGAKPTKALRSSCGLLTACTPRLSGLLRAETQLEPLDWKWKETNW